MVLKKEHVYNPTVDILRVLSILAVIGIHTSTTIIDAAANNVQLLPGTLFFNQLVRFGVPLFFMISGFVLALNYQFHTNYLTYLKKRLSKVFVPYLVWSFIYFYIYIPNKGNFFTALVEGSASYQLYFIPALLIFYLIFPFLHTHYKKLANGWVLLALGFIQITLLSYDYYIHGLPLTSPFNIVLLNFYVFILGMSAAHHQKRIMHVLSQWKYLLTGLTIFLVIYIFLEGHNGYVATHYYRTFYSQWRPSVLLYTITLASVLYYFLSQYNVTSDIFKKLARLSYFVFFIHIIVLETIWDRLPHSILQYEIVFFVLTTFFSFLAAYLVQKIPYVRRVVGF